MPRPLRIDVAGAISHITARGADRCPIFRSDGDRRDFLKLLAGVAERFAWDVYAYCLMTNHYHLLVQPRWPTLSAGMQRLSGIHAQRFNRNHGRTGHLFGARFASPLVEGDSHLLLAARYIVLNPVRAGLCPTAADWPWSSYRATAGLAPAGFLALDRLLPLLGTTDERARRRYREFIADGESLALARQAA